MKQHPLDITDTAEHEARRRGWNLWAMRRIFPGRAETIYHRNALAAVLDRLHWPLADIADACGYPSDEACQFGIAQGKERGEIA
jgi:hypothetical protein